MSFNGAAYKNIPSSNIPLKDLEKDLILVGLFGMIDPPRDEVKNSISLCKKAGITPIMITGDHKNTAFAIAKELKIASNPSECMSGNEIDSYSQADFNLMLQNLKFLQEFLQSIKLKL